MQLRSISSEQTKETVPCQWGVRMLTLTARVTLSGDVHFTSPGPSMLSTTVWSEVEMTGEGGGEGASLWLTESRTVQCSPPALRTCPLSSPQQLLVCCYCQCLRLRPTVPSSPLSLCCKINPSWCSLLAVAWCLLTAWLGLPSLTDWGMRTGQHTHSSVLLL